MPNPVTYVVPNWTAVLTCGAVGAQQVANLGGTLTEFKGPAVKHVVIEKKFCATGGVTPIPTGTFDKLECGFKIETLTDSIEAAIARGIAGAATLVITGVANSTADIANTKIITYTLVGQIVDLPYCFNLKAQETGEAEFSMMLTGISKGWGNAANRQLNPIQYELLEGVTNFLSAYKTGLGL